MPKRYAHLMIILAVVLLITILMEISTNYTPKIIRCPIDNISIV